MPVSTKPLIEFYKPTNGSSAANLDGAESPEWSGEGSYGVWHDVTDDHDLGRVLGNKFRSHFGGDGGC